MSEENGKVKPRWSLKWRFYYACFKLAIVLAGSLAVAHFAQEGWSATRDKALELHQWVLNRLTVTKYVTEFKHPTAATLDEIITQVSHEYKIDPLILRVISEKESSGGLALYRFEPEQFQRRLGEDRRLGLSEDERRMENSSHGIFHIMGYTARNMCNMHWSELYNPWLNAKCAATIVQQLQQTSERSKSPDARVFEIFKKFNGQGPMADAYANDAMVRLAKLLYQKTVS